MTSEDPIINPYEAPKADVAIESPLSDSEDIRNQHLKHEASVKSVGSLYILGGIIMILGAIFSFSQGDLNWINLLYLVFGLLGIATAVALRKLLPIGRIGSAIFSVIGLLGFPIGTIISAYILYLLFSPKGKMVFSPEYKTVIAETPHIRYQTSIIIKVFIVLILLLFLASILVPVINAISNGSP